MRRVTAIGLLVVTMSGCLPNGPDPGATPPPPSRSVPWCPTLHTGPRSAIAPCSTASRAKFPWNSSRCSKTSQPSTSSSAASHANNPRVSLDLEEQGWLRWTPAGTRVLVLKINDRHHIGGRVAAQFRVLDGPHKGRTAWAPLAYVTQFRRMTDQAE